MPRIPPLNIAMISTPWFELPPAGYGGTEAMCAALVDGLVELGHQVTVIGVGHNGTLGRFVATYETPQGDHLGSVGPEVVHAARAAGTLASLRPDVIHDHSTAGPLQARRRRAPTVVTAHGPVSGVTGEYYRALGDTVHLVAISRAQQAQAPDILWSGQIYNAVRTADYPYRLRKGRHALFLGRLAADKGVHLAIDAARRADMPILIAGACNDPAERAYVDAEVRPRLGEDARWIGEADHATKLGLLADARCLVFPICWEEPFGMVMVEAMACGTPVVALRRGSVPEIVDDGVTGFICDRPEQLPAALRSVDRLSPQACRERVCNRFDTLNMASAYQTLYRLLAGDRTQPATAVSGGRPRD
ncbi:glycosyltransferase family 4 protein [Streptomyces rishiriensis]|uniref:Glycosyltransferase involved in cell wall biosynthesis n=1 Tax=Streptomyces rishiriensis TaxID=68264 RepID=A0ABU0NGZ6_STRRH|nr:glycosyltransferase family 4 protein [Streptomyces rishiriensis]MDQ0578374.1 glycosyltransferase involved in cell wall biosynthesis [Streptomyces rishiriensis]